MKLNLAVKPQINRGTDFQIFCHNAKVIGTFKDHHRAHEIAKPVAGSGLPRHS